MVLACDNLASNGTVLRQACIDFAALRADGLAQWIARNVQFPNTMVDRIVPATTPAHRQESRAVLALADDAPVSCEPYCQWVIESFDGPRPRWEAAGAEWVRDVAPWEASKLRLLNGGHLAIAYLGLLAGAETVAEAMALPGFDRFALRFMLDEQSPTLPRSDHDIAAYVRQLLLRWRNPCIEHRLDRVGRDGSGKLPSRLLASLRDNLEASRPAPCTLLALAAWMLCSTSRRAFTSRLLFLQDRMAGRLWRLGRNAGHEPSRLVQAFLRMPEVFGDDLHRRAGLPSTLTRMLSVLQNAGPCAAVADCLSGALS